MKQVVALHNAFKEKAAQSPNPTAVTSEQFREILAEHGFDKNSHG